MFHLSSLFTYKKFEALKLFCAFFHLHCSFLHLLWLIWLMVSGLDAACCILSLEVGTVEVMVYRCRHGKTALPPSRVYGWGEVVVAAIPTA